MAPSHDAVDPAGRPQFGRWTHDLTTGRWWFSPEVVAMWDIGIDTHGPVETVLARLREEDRPLIEERLGRTLSEGAPLSGQGRLHTEHGERIFAFYGDLVESEQGRVVTGYSIDVTEEARRAVQDAVVGMRRHGQAIEHLKGALMVVYGMDEPAAFNVLRTVSMQHNVKLNLVAERTMALAVDRADRSTSLIDVVEESARAVAARTSDSKPPRRERSVVLDPPASAPRRPQASL